MTRRAFTLVELIATLAILALFAGLVTVAASKASRRSADRRAISLVMLMDTQARAEAFRTGQQRDLVLDTVGRRVGITDGTDERWRALPSGLESVELDVFQLDEPTRSTVRITPDGSSPAYRFTVRISRDARARSLFVTSAGSIIQLEPGDSFDAQQILSTRPDAG